MLYREMEKRRRIGNSICTEIGQYWIRSHRDIDLGRNVFVNVFDGEPNSQWNGERKEQLGLVRKHINSRFN